MKRTRLTLPGIVTAPTHPLVAFVERFRLAEDARTGCWRALEAGDWQTAAREASGAILAWQEIASEATRRASRA